MIDTANNYCVYYHKNIINNKLYIGMSKDVTKRWKNNGKQYKPCKFFWRAIEKYGWDNFEHVIVIDNISKNMAELIEKELIKKYKTQDKNFGYNLASGGTGGATTRGKTNASSKPVYQYNFDGTYIKEWENAQRPSEFYNICVSDIHANCRLEVRKAGNYMWSYVKLPYMKPYVKLTGSRESILQIDKSFNIVKRYECISYVDDSIYTREKVTNCCKKKALSHKDYYWCYEKDFNEFYNYIKEKLKTYNKWHTHTKHIRQRDLQMNILAEYKSATEAEELTGFNRHTIQAYCKRPEMKHGIASGYYWEYV